MACRLVASKQLSGPMVVYYQSTVRYKGYDEIDSEYILKKSFENIGNLRNDIMNKNAYPFTKYIKHILALPRFPIVLSPKQRCSLPVSISIQSIIAVDRRIKQVSVFQMAHPTGFYNYQCLNLSWDSEIFVSVDIVYFHLIKLGEYPFNRTFDDWISFQLSNMAIISCKLWLMAQWKIWMKMVSTQISNYVSR